nr:ADP-ribosylation factor-like protein 2 [Ipomoea batatas]
MGLLSIIRKIKKKEKEMRILMVGLDNSGKTTIVLKINGEDTSVISPTLGFNIKTIAYQKYTLNIWDVGGQKTIRSYWRNYFEQTDGLVWVVDSSDLRRLDDCRYELHNLLKEERLSGASLLIFANKQDIQGSLCPDEIAKVLNLDAMDKTRHWRIVGCSAYTGEGLLEGFDCLPITATIPLGSMAINRSNMIARIVRLKQVVKRWRNKAAVKGSEESGGRNRRIRSGSLAVYVGHERRRFVIPTRFLNLPAFISLLEKAEEEFGFQSAGGLVLPCEPGFFQGMLRLLQRDEDRFGNMGLDEILKMISEPLDHSCREAASIVISPLLQKTRV